MTAPAESRFAVFRRGEKREELLAYFRTGLRLLTNPATGAAFTETEIATATAVGSRWYAEADALDLLLLAEQNRGLWLADQVLPDSASTQWLKDYHGDLWDQVYLAATGGSGPVQASALPGTVFIGSSTVGDPAATYGTDPAGLRYQVLVTTATPGSGTAALTLVGIDTGAKTNIAAGTAVTWANPPVNAQPKATVTTTFTGGIDAETDADFVKRLKARIRHKPAAGNSAHFRAWARDASNSVEDACIFSCFNHAGSVLVAVLQKRGSGVGPNARIPAVGVLSAVTAYLTPASSPVVPARALVVVVAPVPQSSAGIMQLALPRGLASGWADQAPWPGLAAVSPVVASITVLTNQTHFTMHCDTDLPTGVTAPSLMVWNDATTRFERLLVSSVSGSAGTYTVVLTSPPTKTLAVGDYISPYSARLDLLGTTIETYFDSLGPGEVIDLAADERAHRAFRFPQPNEELPQRAGASLLTYLLDALGGVAADATLVSMTPTTPSLPADPITGPSLLVAGRMGIYAS